MPHRRIYSWIVAGAIAWCALIVTAPALVSSGGDAVPAGMVIYEFFQRICHQELDRSLFFMGEPLGVCARCAAIYFAFLVSLCLSPLLLKQRFTIPIPPKIVLIGSAVPMLLDVGLGILGMHAVTMSTRVLTGAVFGASAGFILLPDALKGVSGLFKNTSILHYEHERKTP